MLRGEERMLQVQAAAVEVRVARVEVEAEAVVEAKVTVVIAAAVVAKQVALIVKAVMVTQSHQYNGKSLPSYVTVISIVYVTVFVNPSLCYLFANKCFLSESHQLNQLILFVNETCIV